MNDSDALYNKHRPALFKHVHGQEAVVSVLQSQLKSGKLPRVLLLSGPSGTGKTTLSRILKGKLNCGDADYKEINAAEDRGIDLVREIKRGMGYKPIDGDCRIWYLDEAHKLTNDAQNAMLKPLEDTPPHVRFIIATTDPNKLIKTFRSRCFELALAPVGPTHLKSVIQNVLEKEKQEISEEVMDKLVNIAAGSARFSVQLLSKVLSQKSEEDQLEVLAKHDVEVQAFDLAKALIANKPWSDVAKLLKAIDEDAEGLRRMILGYAQGVLLNSGKGNNRAAYIIEELRDHLYDIGKPGLTLACYNVSQRK